MVLGGGSHTLPRLLFCYRIHPRTGSVHGRTLPVNSTEAANLIFKTLAPALFNSFKFSTNKTEKNGKVLSGIFVGKFGFMCS